MFRCRFCPPELRNCAVVENGVVVHPLHDTPKEDFAIVLGRICPEKNAHAALEAGTLAGMPVLLAGRIFPYAALALLQRADPASADRIGAHGRKWVRNAEYGQRHAVASSSRNLPCACRAS
jgi:hypothetical protein